MFDPKLIEDPSTRSVSSDPLELLQDQLADLLLIHLQHLYSETSPLESPSIYLRECQFVSGERHAAKSYMRFALLIGQAPEAHAADERLTLELSVSPRKN